MHFMRVLRICWVVPEFAVCGLFGVCSVRLDSGKAMIIQPADQSPELSPLERNVLETALSTGSMDAGLRNQIESARVIGRTPSGVGFMTKLSVPAGQRVAADVIAVPIVVGEHPALPSGAEFVLQVKDGRLNSIEAFCHEGMWPVTEDEFRISAALNGKDS